MPPRRLRFVGQGDFEEVGDRFLGHFVELGGLRPDARVLDTGSGVGRMAVPLTGFLRDGSYEGFDVVPQGVRWCQRNITPRFPNFQFQRADLFNTKYNPRGGQSASGYRFPYADASFDFAFATSLFTHLLPAEIENYLRETARVLSPGGTSFATFIVLDREAARLRADGRADYDIGEPQTDDSGRPYWTPEARTPESGVAISEEFVREAYASAGLEIVEPIHHGSWSGRTETVEYQDVIVARKPS